MSNAKHSPGPFTSESDFGALITSASGVNIAVVLNQINASKNQSPVPHNLDEVRANASLFKAAPDLLEAVKAALGAANELVISSSGFPRAALEEAIAKAEGGAS